MHSHAVGVLFVTYKCEGWLGVMSVRAESAGVLAESIRKGGKLQCTVEIRGICSLVLTSQNFKVSAFGLFF